MLRLLNTLIRGAASEAEEALFDANATRVLAQQLREAATALEFAKKELACAMAHRSSEQRAAQMLSDRIAGLEQAAIEAIGAGRADLAEETATVIAAAQDERRDRQAAIERFDTDIARLRHLTEEGHRRLRELRRGLEMARAREALNRAGANGRRALVSGAGALREAEQTLARLQEGAERCDDVHAALEELERRESGRDLDERLAKAGFGLGARTKPSDVLAGLVHRASEQGRAAQPAASAQAGSETQDTGGAGTQGTSTP